MRSFLVLVLLGGIVCSFHGVLSEEFTGTGTYFSITEENSGDGIQVLRFFFGLFGFLRGIQAKIGGEWSSKYGVPGGYENSVVLYDGESITKISGQKGMCIRFLEVQTSLGRIYRLGKAIGNHFDEFPPRKDMRLSGIEGFYNLICIKKLKFHWSDISYEASTPSEVTNTTF